MPTAERSGDDEQSELERLAIARRYREQRGAKLRELARPHVEGEIEAVGEFSTLPLESLAAIPVLGAFFAFIARARSSRKGSAPNVLLALDPDRLYRLSVRTEIAGTRAEPAGSWPRAGARVAAIERKFMRDRVIVELEDEEPLCLYASSLRTNPWAAALISALGGDAPTPLDLGEEAEPASEEAPSR